jgi:hypothetical protein
LDDAKHGDLLQIFFRVARASGDVARNSGSDVTVLQGQSIGGGMGIHRPMAPRLGWEGDHQLNGIPLAAGSRMRSSSNPDALGTVWP